MFSNKSKVVDAEWKIEIFRQGKKLIANFMIEFQVLAIKAETNDLYCYMPSSPIQKTHPHDDTSCQHLI